MCVRTHIKRRLLRFANEQNSAGNQLMHKTRRHIITVLGHRRFGEAADVRRFHLLLVYIVQLMFAQDRENV